MQPLLCDQALNGIQTGLDLVFCRLQFQSVLGELIDQAATIELASASGGWINGTRHFAVAGIGFQLDREPIPATAKWRGR